MYVLPSITVGDAVLLKLIVSILDKLLSKFIVSGVVVVSILILLPPWYVVSPSRVIEVGGFAPL